MIAEIAFSIIALVPFEEFNFSPSPRDPALVVTGERQVPKKQQNTPVAPALRAPTVLSEVKPSWATINAAFRSICPRDSYVVGLLCQPADSSDSGTEPRPVAEPVVTAGEIERAVREVGVPALQVRIEPAATTLVNLPTNLYAEPEEFDRTVDVLGAEVRVRASASSFTWHHGDGSSQSTTSPGRPYPHLDVTHRYRKAGENLAVSVDVVYNIDYAIGSGPWQRLESTITATGPAAAITVREAAPALVHR